MDKREVVQFDGSTYVPFTTLDKRGGVPYVLFEFGKSLGTPRVIAEEFFRTPGIPSSLTSEYIPDVSVSRSSRRQETSFVAVV